jgi:hypothetical protein
MKTMKIPGGPQEITPEWLTDALRETGVVSGARVTRADVNVVGEGSGFIGQLARVALAYDRPQPGAPASLIAKFPGASEGGRQIGNLFRFYEREIRFYEEIAEKIELRTPRRYYSAMDVERGEYVLLLEDLHPARVGDQTAGCTVGEAELAVRELAKFHASWWEHPTLSGMDWMLMINDVVHQSAQQSYADAWQPFIDNFGQDLPADFLELAEEVGRNVINLQHALAEKPWTIVHGDYRLDNLFFGSEHGGPEFAVADWQITSRGRGIFDLAYLVIGGLEPATRKAHELDLLRMYHEILLARGVRGYEWEQCLREYRMSALYVLVYVVISLGTLDFANERGLALFRAWLERIRAALADLDPRGLMPS